MSGSFDDLLDQLEEQDQLFLKDRLSGLTPFPDNRSLDLPPLTYAEKLEDAKFTPPPPKPIFSAPNEKAKIPLKQDAGIFRDPIGIKAVHVSGDAPGNLGANNESSHDKWDAFLSFDPNSQLCRCTTPPHPYVGKPNIWFIGEFPRIFYGYNGRCARTIWTSNMDFDSIFRFLADRNLFSKFNGDSVIFFSLGKILGEIGASDYLKGLVNLITKVEESCRQFSKNGPLCPLITPPTAYLCEMSQEGPLEADRLSQLLSLMRDHSSRDSPLYAAINLTTDVVASLMPDHTGDVVRKKARMGAGNSIPPFPQGGLKGELRAHPDIQFPLHFLAIQSKQPYLTAAIGFDYAFVRKLTDLFWEKGALSRYTEGWPSPAEIARMFEIRHFFTPQPAGTGLGELVKLFGCHANSLPGKVSSRFPKAEKKILVIGDSHGNKFVKGETCRYFFLKLSTVISLEGDQLKTKLGELFQGQNFEGILLFFPQNQWISGKSGGPLERDEFDINGGRFHFKFPPKLPDNKDTLAIFEKTLKLCHVVRTVLGANDLPTLVVGPFPRHLSACCRDMYHMGAGWSGQSYVDLVKDVNDALLVLATDKNFDYVHFDRIVGTDWFNQSNFSGDGVHVSNAVIERIKKICLHFFFGVDKLQTRSDFSSEELSFGETFSQFREFFKVRDVDRPVYWQVPDQLLTAPEVVKKRPRSRSNSSSRASSSSSVTGSANNRRPPPLMGQVFHPPPQVRHGRGVRHQTPGQNRLPHNKKK